MSEAPESRLGTRVRAALPAIASFVVAGAAAGYLAIYLAPRYDEFHTLAYLQDDGLGSLWKSYRDVGDTLPPLAYTSWWVWSRAAGTSLLAARIPSVLGWAVAAAAVSGLTRRAGAWASFAAGVLASATALVFLGAFARPYAVALALLALGLWCWQRSDGAARPGRWLVASGLLFAAAAALHYATAAVAVVVAIVAFVGLDRDRRGWGPVVAPAAGGLAPVLLSAALLPGAIGDQGRLEATARPVDAVAFWPSTLRPAAVVLSIAALLVGLAWCWPGDDRVAVRRRLQGRSSLRVGWALVIAIPVVTVAAMALTSGTYVHRYSIGALLGAAILVAEAVGRAGRRWAWTSIVVAVALVAGAGWSVHVATTQMVSEHRATQMASELGASSSGDEVVVLDEYEFLLLRHAAAPDLARRLRLGDEPAVAHSPEAVDLAERLQHPDGPPVDVIGPPGAIEALVRTSNGWEATEREVVMYPRAGWSQTLVLATLAPV